MHTALPQRGRSPSLATPFSEGDDDNDNMFLAVAGVLDDDDDESQTRAPGALATPNLNTSQQGKSATTLGLRQRPWRRRRDPELKAALECAAITVAPPQKAKRKQVT
jgi:hypothetical protein